MPFDVSVIMKFTNAVFPSWLTRNVEVSVVGVPVWHDGVGVVCVHAGNAMVAPLSTPPVNVAVPSVTE